jgi:hypothetical protein
MSAALSFSASLNLFRHRAWLLRAEEEPPVPPDDPTRNPNWCWTHGQIYPACAGQHEEQK